MFDKLAGLSGLMQLPAKMEEIANDLKSKKVTGSAGGGMVTVEMTGTGEVTAVRIKPELCEDQEMLEELLPAAVNEATGKAKALHAEAMQGVTGGIPGLEDTIAKFTGGGGS